MSQVFWNSPYHIGPLQLPSGFALTLTIDNICQLRLQVARRNSKVHLLEPFWALRRSRREMEVMKAGGKQARAMGRQVAVEGRQRRLVEAPEIGPF